MLKTDKSSLRRILKKKLEDYLGCTLQHDGWSCNSCFHGLKLNLKEDIHEYWLAVLAIRGDYPSLPQRLDLIEELIESL